MRSTSSAGTSSMNRDGSLDWYSPKMRRRAAPVSTRLRPRARHADVAEPPLLLELLFVLARSRVREQPFLEAGEDDDRKLEPLGAVQRHHPDAGVARALLLVDVGEQRQAIDEAAERRLRLAALVLARGRHQLGEVLDAAFGLLAALVAQILQVAALIEHLADRDRHRFLPRDSVSADDQIAKRRRATRRRGR